MAKTSKRKKTRLRGRVKRSRSGALRLRSLRSLSDARARDLLRFVEKAILARPPRRRELGHLIRAANWILERSGDAVVFDEVDKDRESAHFDEVWDEVVIDEGLRKHPLELSGAVLVHELQHAYDEMTGRPYTLEAEVRAFRAESIFLSWFPPKKVAAKVRDANGWHWFGYIYKKRLDALRGALDLEHGTVFDFMKSTLGEAKFEGLQKIEKVRMDVRQAMEIKAHEREELRGLLAKRPLPPAERRSLRARLEILDADLDAGRRVEKGLREEQARVRRGNPLAV